MKALTFRIRVHIYHRYRCVTWQAIINRIQHFYTKSSSTKTEKDTSEEDKDRMNFDLIDFNLQFYSFHVHTHTDLVSAPESRLYSIFTENSKLSSLVPALSPCGWALDFRRPFQLKFETVTNTREHSLVHIQAQSSRHQDVQLGQSRSGSISSRTLRRLAVKRSQIYA